MSAGAVTEEVMVQANAQQVEVSNAQVNGVWGASLMLMIDGIANLDNGGSTSVRYHKP